MVGYWVNFRKKATAPTKRAGPYTCLPFTLAPSLSFRRCYPKNLLQCLRSDDWQHRINTTAFSGGNLHSFLMFVVRRPLESIISGYMETAHQWLLLISGTEAVGATACMFSWMQGTNGKLLSGANRGTAFPLETKHFPLRHTFLLPFNK